MASLVDRMIRASKLDVNLYEEVEADKGAMGQALAVVVISSVAAGIGTLGVLGIRGLIFGTLGALIGWFIWAFLAFVIGTKLLPEPQTKSDMGEMLRTIGFASSPGVIRILAFIPFLGAIISIVASVWMLVAMIIAVRQALDYKSTWRAIAVTLIGFIIYFIIFAVIFSALGVAPPAAA
ncbi:MAG: YIP1 family protein [Deltaproteobacteria bacterium]